MQHPLRVLPEAAAEVQRHLSASAGNSRVALLFGSEKTGLSNDELSHCHWLLTIPMTEHADVRHPSMNLGQAVAVCLYELVRAQSIESAGDTSGDVAAPASAAEVERVTALLLEVLEKTGYRRHHPANSDEADIRRLVVRMGISSTDAPVWMGMLRQMLWKMAHDQGKVAS